MRSGMVSILAATLFVTAPAGHAQSTRPLRNAYGQPDLEGVWSSMSMTRLERPAGAPLTFATKAEGDAYQIKRRGEIRAGRERDAGSSRSMAYCAGFMDRYQSAAEIELLVVSRPPRKNERTSRGASSGSRSPASTAWYSLSPKPPGSRFSRCIMASCQGMISSTRFWVASKRAFLGPWASKFQDPSKNRFSRRSGETPAPTRLTRD